MKPELPSSGPLEQVVIEIQHLRSSVVRGSWLLVETVIVPSALVYACLHTVGQVWGLVAVIGWCLLVVLVRRIRNSHIPGTLLLVAGVLVLRSAIALALSSVYVYLLQPVLGSVVMALVFLGSAAVGRPVTRRLAQDFVALPGRVFAQHGVHRMFVEVSVLWGGSRLLDAGMGLFFLRWGIDAGLVSRGLLSVVLTVLSVLGCSYWGWRCLKRTPQVVLRIDKLPRPGARDHETGWTDSCP